MAKQSTPELHKLQPIQKAAALIIQGRVHLTAAQVYLVDGDTGTYRVIAAIDGIFCPCQARTPLCSHVIAVAQVRAGQPDACRVCDGKGRVLTQGFRGHGPAIDCWDCDGTGAEVTA